MKKILVVLVLFCWVSLWDCHPIYAEETIKGNCGESVFWEYSNGLLRIYGNGEMKTNPWMNYKDCRENLRKVIIDEGVTAVCEKAFNTTKGDSLDYDYLAEKSGPTRTWYNARVTQFSKGLKGDVKVFPMIDKIMVKKKSAKKAVMVSKVLLKDYLTADSIDLGYISKDPGPRYLMFQARYADNKHMKNAKYLPLLSHEWTRRFALKNLA